MKVKVSKTCFVGGALRKEGTVFNYEGKPNKYLVPVGGPALPVAVAEELTKEDLRAKLAEYGVKTAPQTSREKLLKLLSESEGESAPEESNDTDMDVI